MRQAEGRATEDGRDWVDSQPHALTCIDLRPKIKDCHKRLAEKSNGTVSACSVLGSGEHGKYESGEETLDLGI